MMNAAIAAPARPCTCGYHCPTCAGHVDPSRAIGWDPDFCSPLCERKAKDKAAALFAAWWSRPRS